MIKPVQPDELRFLDLLNGSIAIVEEVLMHW